MSSLGLGLLLLLLLVLPLSVRWAEEEIELFLLLGGIAAVSISGQWSATLIHSALTEPLPLTLAVLGAGLCFRRLQPALRRRAAAAQARFPRPLLWFLIVFGLGLASAFITAVIAALILAEVLSALSLSRRERVHLAVLTCFSIGLGSAMTPLGGPLAAVSISRLRGEPYHADFWFMARGLLLPTLGLMLSVAALAMRLADRSKDAPEDVGAWADETWRGLLWRGVKTFLFVVGLVLLGQGFAPAAARWLLTLPKDLLYWANMSSAVLDNATLAAAEIGPTVPPDKLRALLYSLMISGGMLIPGNIPNIICANKLGIRPKEWAVVGVPLGLLLMTLMACLLAFIER